MADNRAQLSRKFKVITIDGSDHDHPAFTDQEGNAKEFTGPSEVLIAAQDFCRENPGDPGPGEFRVHEVFSIVQSVPAQQRQIEATKKEKKTK